MTAVEIFEAVMLLCFSVSWYWPISSMLRTRSVSGRSLQFILMISIGYMFGIASKLIAWQSGGSLSLLVWVYGWNALVILFNAALVIRFSTTTRATDRDESIDVHRPLRRRCDRGGHEQPDGTAWIADLERRRIRPRRVVKERPGFSLAAGGHD